MTRAHTTRTLGAILFAASAACRPVSAPKPEAEPDPRTSSTSDAVLTPGKDQHVYSTMEELIEAKAPGVQVIRTNGSFSLRIRGLSSFQGSNDPLIIVDGHPSELPGARALESINPNDVVRIEVLKDAASTASYGARGAYGVIVVSTRKR
jgi:TonB-dependent SusC/RagA subfamily outer membrane receptor